MKSRVKSRSLAVCSREARSRRSPGLRVWVLTALSLGMAIGLSASVCAEDEIESTKTTFSFYPSFEGDVSEEMKCPSFIQVVEKHAPYRPASYAWSGYADFRAFAEPFSIARQNRFTVVWEAKLKPPYSLCVGTAAPKPDEKGYVQKQYLGLRFFDGKVEFELDMTGESDANQATLSIRQATVKNGTPVWTLEGTD